MCIRAGGSKIRTFELGVRCRIDDRANSISEARVRGILATLRNERQSLSVLRVAVWMLTRRLARRI